MPWYYIGVRRRKELTIQSFGRSKYRYFKYIAGSNEYSELVDRLGDDFLCCENCFMQFQREILLIFPIGDSRISPIPSVGDSGLLYSCTFIFSEIISYKLAEIRVSTEILD